MECRVQGTLLDKQLFARDLLNPLRDGPTMLGFHGDRFQNEEIERALYEIGWLGHTPRLPTIVDDHQTISLARHGVFLR
jgi:hypothetical protein